MNGKRALEIANEFLHYMNPDLWNGEGETPRSFNCGGIYEPEDRFGNLHLEIRFENETEVQGDWCVYVDLVDCGCTVEFSSCYGVNSPQNIADCIEAVCQWNGIGNR